MYPTKYSKLVIAGLILFAFSLPLSKSASNVLIGLMYLGVLTLAALDQAAKKAVLKNVRQPLLLPFVLFVCSAVIGLLFTEHLVDGFGIVNKLGGLLLVYFMVSVLVDSLNNGETAFSIAEKLLLAFLVGLAVLNVIGVLTYLGIVGHKRLVLPLVPLNVHHIWYSNMNAIGVYAAAAFLLFSERGRTAGGRALLVSSAALAALCIMLSLSRTAWFGMALTAGIMTYLIIKNKKVYFITLAAAVAACVAVYLVIPFVHARINLIVSDIASFSMGDTATSLGERFLMWKAASRMFLSNPVFGVGTGEYFHMMDSYIRAGEFPEYLYQFNQPHNMYLFALATNGLVGLSALLYILYRGLRFALPLKKFEGSKRLFAFLAAATVVHFMIAGMTDSFFNIQILRYTFGFVMGVCVRAALTSAHSS